MIRIQKSGVSPPDKLNNGVTLTQDDCTSFDKHKESYVNGETKFEFDENVYGHKSVKESLEKSQNGKCCYCEGKFSAYYYGDVEHYRPKGAVKQASDKNRIYPGYYWLAYSWNNLYYCCSVCNNNKRDLFPLENPKKRARSHHQDLAEEEPLLLDPGGANDPQNHIKFKNARAEALTIKGQKTIEIIDLNRPNLLEDRLELYRNLKIFIELIRALNHSSDEWRAKIHCLKLRLAEASKPCAKFSAMATCLIGDSDIETSQ